MYYTSILKVTCYIKLVNPYGLKIIHKTIFLPLIPIFKIINKPENKEWFITLINISCCKNRKWGKEEIPFGVAWWLKSLERVYLNYFVVQKSKLKEMTGDAWQFFFLKDILRAWIEDGFLFSEGYLLGGSLSSIRSFIIFVRHCAYCWDI